MEPVLAELERWTRRLSTRYHRTQMPSRWALFCAFESSCLAREWDISPVGMLQEGKVLYIIDKVVKGEGGD